ncbi:hypothetical protein C7413_107144 [Paraburkholderia silvatlantica]|nr:hypothetical protein C7411_107144 [Paraburkholderia silvatlantica]PXW38823.1 hypothetical protein C7413_107144 [Paraburkholderia silvatlantica]
MVAIETASGYSSRAGSNNKRGVTALLWALDEIARVMTIDGRAGEARDCVNKAIARTQRDLDGKPESTTETNDEN